MTDQTMLNVTGLNTFYGRAQILFDLELSVGSGEVVVLLGRNGAGKSTTFKSIMGIVKPAAGEVVFNGHAIQRAEPYKISRLGLGYVPEERRIFKGLSVMENMEVGRQPAREGNLTWTPERLFEVFPNLAEMRNRSAGQMSGGEQQMLTIARTLMGNPALILLDEPSEGLAPVILDQLAHTITELKREGVSILLSEQNLHFAEMVSDRAYIVESGRIQYQGSMKELAAHEEIAQAYLMV